jgi:hypothetical protein
MILGHIEIEQFLQHGPKDLPRDFFSRGVEQAGYLELTGNGFLVQNQVFVDKMCYTGMHGGLLCLSDLLAQSV